MRFVERLVAISIVITFGALPAQAQLLGGSGSLVSLSGGSAGSSSTVNVGLGNGGGSNSVASVSLGSGDSSRSLATVRSGRAGTDSAVNVGLGGRDGSGNVGSLQIGGTGGATLLVGVNLGGLGFSSNEAATLNGQLASAGGGGLSCSLGDGRQVLAMASDGTVGRNAVSGWQRASNVQIRPMRMCPDADRQVHRVLDASDKMILLHSLVARDPLIMASLQRTRFDQDDVFAVERRGNMLLVYVF